MWRLTGWGIPFGVGLGSGRKTAELLLLKQLSCSFVFMYAPKVTTRVLSASLKKKISLLSQNDFDNLIMLRFKFKPDAYFGRQNMFF